MHIRDGQASLADPGIHYVYEDVSDDTVARSGAST